ncbi:MAG: hypothetical protein ACD_11C00070G0001 [uncultured bacterium]|nr:MAG: hypothetical protein ACD_11C00070G0001 [uncultured bacterium]
MEIKIEKPAAKSIVRWPGKSLLVSEFPAELQERTVQFLEKLRLVKQIEVDGLPENALFVMEQMQVRFTMLAQEEQRREWLRLFAQMKEFLEAKKED